VSLAVQSFSKWIIILGYEMNKDYIAASLCENRAKPACCCKGKCFLRKQLVADENQQQSSGRSFHQQDNRTDLFLTQRFQIDAIQGIPLIRGYGQYLVSGLQQFSQPFFQPPPYARALPA
jgi:hypothetical protein